MPLIPFPNVPNYPGVPEIPRLGPGLPSIALPLALAIAGNLSGTASTPTWAIVDENNVPLYTPVFGGTLSTFSVSFTRQMQISDYPIEANATGQGAAFASFNKVWQPANPIVTLALSGPDAELGAFLDALDAACVSTNLYTVLTPDAIYQNYSIESYTYERTAQRGATMLLAEISLKQILQVSPQHTYPLPQAASAIDAVNAGLVSTNDPSAAVQSQIPGADMLGVGVGQ